MPTPTTTPTPATVTADNDHLPNYLDFHSACLTCQGSCGDDGWLANELKDIVRFMPYFAEELHDLWVNTTKAAETLLHHLQNNDEHSHIIMDLIDFIWTWRTVGIPKKTDNECGERPGAILASLTPQNFSATFRFTMGGPSQHLSATGHSTLASYEKGSGL